MLHQQREADNSVMEEELGCSMVDLLLFWLAGSQKAVLLQSRGINFSWLSEIASLRAH